MNDADMQVDLTNCDREPIHLLGSIQPFGALVAVNADWAVAYHSANFDAMLGAGTELTVGTPTQDVFTRRAIETLRRHLPEQGQVGRIFGLQLTSDGALFDVALHLIGGLTVIEFEPHRAEEFDSHVATLGPVMQELELQDDILQLSETAARQLKQILGFDRVMVYKFHPDESGEVIAEAREDELEAFLGLRYPSTDIPRQARQLYLRNRFRIISDVHAEPVPLIPQRSLDGRPLDLSMSTLRSVSPIHIEYLKNMGVGASLSISIVIRGRLWGLFACHHYSPRTLAFSMRTMAELFSQMYSLLLARFISEEENALAEQGQRIHDLLMTRLANDTTLGDDIRTISSAIATIIPHDGISSYVDGNYTATGVSPTRDQFAALVPSLNSGVTSRIYSFPSLGEAFPVASDWDNGAAGAMIIPVSRRPRDFLVLWRKELQRVVTWAGNPEKPIEYGPNGARLTPRKSFAAWRESVTGRCIDWTAGEQRIAESLRVTLLEVVLKLTDEAVLERERSQQQQALLIAELNHRVRNILNLIRSLISQTSRDVQDVPAFSKIIGGRISALATAHDHITRENWSPASLSELISSEAKAYLTGKENRVRITGQDVLIAPEAYTVLALVIHEMMTNSAKYGSLCDRSGTLDIALEPRADGDLALHWRESGGPPVKPPTRRGFGSTIIERSIPHELKGEARIDYKLGGVEARFLVPARYISAHSARADSAAPTEESTEGSKAGLGRLPARALVVEDSMMIALDTEDTLRELGVATVSIASSVESALALLDSEEPELVLLDYNLGTESSDKVAERLRERGIPFIFATGYGDMTGGNGEAAVLKKPYDRDQLVRAIGIACQIEE
ncbi:MAG: GAF domain-containing protein [Sphingomonadales bacterium]|nr:GAF domain-containing protein [Sphingomonadales bacterium]MBD3771999.1 GAF domain-containing protein [Paracoccaceae bacterium]